jgi:hypothetical protein
MTDISLPTSLVGTDFRANREVDRATSDFRVGRVLERTASVLARNFPAFLVVMAIGYVPCVLLVREWVSLFSNHQSPTAQQIVALLGVGLISLLLTTLAQLMVTYGAFGYLRGRRVDIGEALRVAVSRYFPVILLWICTILAEIITAPAIVVPTILSCMWYLAIPACVIEGRGPIESMRRSSELTKGHRWKFFGLAICLGILNAVGSGMLGASLNAMGGENLKLVGDVLWSGVFGAASTIAAVVAYYELRVAKEGIDVEQVAAVFE